MIHAILTVIGFATVWGIISIGKSQSPSVSDDESIEVFRADEEIAHAALDMLCNGGVPAWIETCDDDQALAVHVEKNDVPLVKEVLEESGMLQADV